ncbi:MAG: universal stress protein [Pirellulales bacterium]|nr:universal stress protein [Pirellulales bacterium]
MNWLPRKTVIVPIDFSDDSFTALETAKELADNPACLHVVHVLPVLMASDPGVIWENIDDPSRSEHAAEALRKQLADRGLPRVSVEVRIGDPGHEITAYAEELHADLIVLSSHGRNALTRLLIGSVADRVIHLAHCPVLVLKKPR